MLALIKEQLYNADVNMQESFTLANYYIRCNDLTFLC